METGIEVLLPGAQLSKTQQKQAYEVVFQGFKGKLAQVYENNEEPMKKVLSLINDAFFMPVFEEKFYAVEKKTGEIVGILFLNNNKSPKMLSLIPFFIRLFATTRPSLAFKTVQGLLRLDKITAETSPENYMREIYMVSVREDLRGRGIGSQLLQSVFEYLKKPVPAPDNSKIFLIVYETNPAIHLYKRMGFSFVKKIDSMKFGELAGDKYSIFFLMERGV